MLDGIARRFSRVTVPAALVAQERFDPESSPTGMFTFTGGFDWAHPRVAHVDVRDLAWSLSRTFRYGGHTMCEVSVTDHSMWVASRVAPEYRLHALLHDGAEAYLGDQIRPRKRYMRFIMPDGRLTAFENAEHAVLSVIYEKFGLSGEIPDAVHEADEAVLRWEIEWIKKSRAVGEWLLETSAPVISRERWLRLVVEEWEGLTTKDTEGTKEEEGGKGGGDE